MQHTSIKNKNDEITIFSRAIDSTLYGINVYKIDYDDNISEITEQNPQIQSVQVSNYTLRKYTFILPDEDCIVCVLFDNYPLYIRVGEPKPHFLLYTGILHQNIDYKQINQNDGSILQNGTLKKYNFGFYGIELINIDDTILDVNNFLYPVRCNYPVTINATYHTGTLTLENDHLMNIAIPVKGHKVYEYFLLPLLEKVQEQTPTAKLSDIVEYVKAYPSNNETSGHYLTFLPDLTNINSSNNFNLVSQDGEINGFLCKIKDYSSIYDDVLTFSYTTEDNIEE